MLIVLYLLICLPFRCTWSRVNKQVLHTPTNLIIAASRGFIATAQLSLLSYTHGVANINLLSHY